MYNIDSAALCDLVLSLVRHNDLRQHYTLEKHKKILCLEYFQNIYVLFAEDNRIVWPMARTMKTVF